MRILFNIQNRNYSIFMKLFYRFLLISIFSLIAAKAFSNNIPTTQNDQDKLSVRITIMDYKLESIEGKNQLEISLCDNKVKEYCYYLNRELQLDGKKITKNIKIEPHIDGEWVFVGNNIIRFTPKGYWPSLTKYEVTIDPKIFPYFISLDDSYINFKTRPLLSRVLEMNYLQDPTDLNKKLVQTKVLFNYPIDLASLNNHVSMNLSPKNEAIAFTYNLSEDNFELNIITPIESLEKDERILSFKLDNGIKPLYGGADFNVDSVKENEDLRLKNYGFSNNKREIYSFKEQVLIPSLLSYLKVENLSLEVIKNNKYIPEQFIIIQTNAAITPDELAKNLEVFMLPKDKPASFVGGFVKKDYKWQSPSEITNDIIALSEKISVEPQEVHKSSSLVNSFKINAISGRYLFIKLKQGAKSEGGFILGKDYLTIASTPAALREIKIMSEGSILSLSGEKKLSIYSLGVDKLHVEIDRVNYHDTNHLISQTYANSSFQNPDFKNWSFNQYNISQVFEEDITLNNYNSNSPQYSSFDFSKFFTKKLTANGENKGLFFIKFSHEDPQKNNLIQDQRFILVTDLGFLVKTSQDGTQDVFVVSISKGEPIKGAKVEIIGLNGLTIASATTDKSGHAKLPDVRQYSREKAPTAYIIRAGNDLSFMPYGRVDRQVNYSRFDTSGIVSSSEGLKAYLFSDRSIYRPGEKINIGIIVKQPDWQGDFTNLPLELEVVNSRGQIIENNKVTLNKEGFIDYSFKTNDNSPTGVYNINLYISKDNNTKHSLSNIMIRVGDFLPDRMKIKTAFKISDKKLWIHPENLKASIELTNLYGTPAANRKVSGEIILSPALFYVSAYKNYQFYSGKQSNKSFTDKLADTTTNEQGKADFELNLQKYADATYRLDFFAEGFELDSGRGVRTNKSIIVSSFDYIIGQKADGDLKYINQQSNRIVDLIAIDSDGNKTSSSELELNLKKINYVNSLTKQDNGSYAYQSVPVEESISKQKIIISGESYSYKLPTKSIGDYVTTITDQFSTSYGEVRFSVVGEGNVAGSITKDATLSLKLNKDDYKAGDEIEVNIISPYKGYGLITIETNKVHSFSWFKTEHDNSVQKIKIPNDFEGKGYVNVDFVRSLDSKEIFMSPFSFASISFTSNISKHDQKIILDVEKQIKPGENLRVGYKTKQPGKIVIFAVDEGILLFGKYKNPDPINYFIKDRALEVETSHILDLLLPEFSMLRMSSSVGGDGFSNDGKNLNPFKRKDQPPVAFWSGIIDSTTNEQYIDFQIPDYFNGAVRVIAVSAAVDAIGSTNVTTTVQGDLIISPNLPLFISPNDEFIVPVNIANNISSSGENAKVTLEFQTSNGLTIIDAPKEILVSAGKENSINLKLKATEDLGSAKLSITASYGDYLVNLKSTTSVRPALPIVTNLIAGYSATNKIALAVDRDLYPQLAKIEVSASSLPVGIITGLKYYLNSYPFGCTEQLVSKNFPNVTLFNQPNFTGSMDFNKTAEDLEQIFNQLRERQTYDGGFTLWNNAVDSNDFVSVYTMHFLTDAASKNLPIPEDTFNNGLNYLKNMANRSINSLTEAREKAYAIYVLTRNNEITTNYLANVLGYLEANHPEVWKDDLTSVYIAASYKMLQMIPEADALLNNFNLNNTYWIADYSFYDKLIKYSQYIYIISLHFPERIKSLDKGAIYDVANFIGQGSYNTIASSYAILAAVNYSKAINTTENPNFNISINNGLNRKLTGEIIKTSTLGDNYKKFERKIHHNEYITQYY